MSQHGARCLHMDGKCKPIAVTVELLEMVSP